jgi:hypothetical protein
MSPVPTGMYPTVKTASVVASPRSRAADPAVAIDMAVRINSVQGQINALFLEQAQFRSSLLGATLPLYAQNTLCELDARLDSLHMQLRVLAAHQAYLHSFLAPQCASTTPVAWSMGTEHV